MTSQTPGAPEPLTFEGSTPILRVTNLDASLAYYVDVLGFGVDWRATGFASVSRGRASMMLCEGGQGRPGTWVWIGVSDAEQLFQELRQRGARIRNPPSNYPWALELQVEDPDGHVLRFGSDSKEGEPFGEWLDEEGVRWKF